MGMVHRWQNKDPFAERGVPWKEEEWRARRMEQVPLQAKLSALGRPGGMRTGGLMQITGFARPKEDPAAVNEAGQRGIEAPGANGIGAPSA